MADSSEMRGVLGWMELNPDCPHSFARATFELVATELGLRVEVLPTETDEDIHRVREATGLYSVEQLQAMLEPQPAADVGLADAMSLAYRAHRDDEDYMAFGEKLIQLTERTKASADGFTLGMAA